MYRIPAVPLRCPDMENGYTPISGIRLHRVEQGNGWFLKTEIYTTYICTQVQPRPEPRLCGHEILVSWSKYYCPVLPGVHDIF